MRNAVLLAAVLANAATMAAADCVTCHPAEAKLHAQTAHASALVPALLSAFAQHLPNHALAEAADGYMFTYRKSADGLIARAQRGNEAAEGSIAWVFGSGRRGQTPFIVAGDRYLEHRVSFYGETGYGITPGQPLGNSPDARHALGLWQSPEDRKSCFNCHTTGFIDYSRAFTPGVQCERCHAGAAEHSAEGRGKPVNPGKLDALAQVQLCGQCHRLKPPDGDENNPANVRFQPLRLMKSRCFLEGKIACTTCHVAHHDALRNDPAFYNARCANCHPNELAHVAAQKSGNCIGCHMPKSRLHPALEFTDHFIRSEKGLKSTM